MRNLAVIIVLSLFVLLSYIGYRYYINFLEKGDHKINLFQKNNMMLTSSAFNDGGQIPILYTCDDRDLNPPLSFVNPPVDTKSFALTVIDPDSQTGKFVHWLVFNIPAKYGGIAEGIVPLGAEEGTNDFGNPGYGGPCPRDGAHHYVFTLYAMDNMLELNRGATITDFEDSSKNHVLQKAVFTGIYKKN
jgi:Raf kinase inhibitor-like YbhB/YbcL family protein